MEKLPNPLRYIKKPDHIAFIIGFGLLFAIIPLNWLELKVAAAIAFSFTIGYELYEISGGDREIVKLDHITFVIAYIILLASFWYYPEILTGLATFLVAFTFGYEVYRVRKRDIKIHRDRQKKS